jgi:hypothetical protein
MNKALYENLMDEYLANNFRATLYCHEKLTLLSDLSYEHDTEEIHKLFLHLRKFGRRIAPVAYMLGNPSFMLPSHRPAQYPEDFILVHSFINSSSSASSASSYRVPDVLFDAMTGFISPQAADQWKDYATPRLALEALASAVALSSVPLIDAPEEY